MEIRRWWPGRRRPTDPVAAFGLPGSGTSQRRRPPLRPLVCGPPRPSASSRAAGTEATPGRGAGAGEQEVAVAAEAMAGQELELCQQQADEVTEIMRNNFDKVLERDGKLLELEQRSDQLLNMSLAFSKTTKTLAQKKRWENIRCRIYLGLAVAGSLLIILIVLLVIFLPTSDGDSGKP